MTKKSKNKALLIILLFLMGITLALLMSEEEKKKMVVKEDYFAVSDVGAITKIVLEGSDFEHIITKDDGQWRLNIDYDIDNSLMEVLLTILNKVKVKRPVSHARRSRVMDILDENGVKVEVHGEDKLLRSFVAAGNEEKTVSYFLDKGNRPYVMYIPGYESYIAGIFELGQNEWRNKVIFSSNWRSLRSVKVNYPNNQRASFEIVFEKDFFKVPGVNKVDTTAMMTYLENLEYFKAENLINPGEFPQYDSLLKTPPFVEISVMDIDTAKNNKLILYNRISEDPYVLGSTSDNLKMLIRYPRVEGLVKRKSDFVRKEIQIAEDG